MKISMINLKSSSDFMFLALGLLLLCLFGCSKFDDDNNEEPPLCLAIIDHAIKVNIYDATTGLPLCGVSGFVFTNNDYRDVDPFSDVECSYSYIQEYGGAGIYQLLVTKSGYQTWVSEPLEVSESRCGLISNNSAAYLELEI